MSRIAALRLRVSDPQRLAGFYCGVLGMHRVGAGDEVAVGYGGDAAVLVLERGAGEGYRHDRLDRYWKIAVTLPNLDLAHAQLRNRGIETTAPHQFRNIAYMSHLADPEGFVIELLQHTFAGQPRTADGDPEAPLGGGARLGLITLRTDDLEREQSRASQAGLHLVSRQAVTDLGFDLYFFAGPNEPRPEPSLDAVANRPWLWQRRYTVLEFQHRLGGVSVGAPQPADRVGAAAITFSTPRGAISLR